MIWRAVSQLIAFLSILRAVSCAAVGSGGFQYHHGVDIWQQNGRTKSTRPGLRWLSDFELPVPKSAYNVTTVEQHTLEQNRFNDILGELDWWGSELDGYDEPEIYDLENGYCNGTFDDGDNCDGTWVGVPVWIEQDLNSRGADVFDGNETFANFGTTFMKRANRTSDLRRTLQNQIDDVERMMKKEYYSIVGDYVGVGFRDSGCRAYIEDTLQGLEQWDLAGSAAATTLYAVIPLLLTIGNLFVVRSSEAYGTSFLVGTMSAMFSLGLPVKSLSAVRGKQRVKVQAFAFKARQSIDIFGKQSRRDATGSRRSAVHPVKLNELQKWSEKPAKGVSPRLTTEQDATDCSFGTLRRRIYKWEPRAHMWMLPALLVFLAQAALFVFAIGPLFLGFGTPLLLFSCSNYLTSLWLIIAAVISALFRLIMWEKGAHERVKIYPLSSESLKTLGELIKDTPISSAQDAYALNTTETELPPLHPPMLTAIGHWIYCSWKRPVTAQWSRSTSSSAKATTLPLPASHLKISQPHTKRFKASVDLLVTTISIAVKFPTQFLQAGFRKHPVRTTAMRTRPLVILMHLSTEGRNPLMTLFTGFIEGLILIILTVFFGASWGGNLLILCYVMAILLVTMTLGRGLGLWYVWRSARLFGLHVIETESARQIIGCLRILCSMKEVLVKVNGSWWFEGHRLDERVGWDDWRLRYENGEFDEDCNTTSPNSSGSGTLGAPLRQKTNQSIVSVAHVPQIPPMSPMRVSSSHVSSQAQQPQTSTIGLARTTNAPPAVSRTQSFTGP